MRRTWMTQLRKAKRLSQADVAERLGVTHQAVSSWEAGTSSPSRSNALALADMLGRDVFTNLLAEERDPARRAS